MIDSIPSKLDTCEKQPCMHRAKFTGVMIFVTKSFVEGTNSLVCVRTGELAAKTYVLIMVEFRNLKEKQETLHRFIMSDERSLFGYKVHV